MAKKRQTYSEEFKMEAVQKWQSSGQSAAQIEKELGISKGSLYKWKQQLGDELGQSSSTPDAAQLEEADLEPAVEVELAATEVSELSIHQEEEEVATEVVAAKTEEVEAVLEDKKAAESEDIVAAATVASTADAMEEPKEEQAITSGATKVLKRIAGVLGVIFGAIGVLLSLAAIAGAWVINTPVTDTGLQILERVEEGLNVASEGLDIAQETLVEAQNTLAEARDALPTEELAGRIGDIRGIIDAAQATAETASSFVQAANSIPFLRGGEPEEEQADTTLAEASATLAEISDSLASIEQELIDRAEGRSGLIGEIETRIANIQARVQEVDQRVGEATTAVVQLQQDLPGLIDTVSIIFTLLFFWLGVAQLSLLLHGWQWLRWP